MRVFRLIDFQDELAAREFLDFGRAEFELEVKNHLKDANQGGEGLSEQGKANAGAFFGLSEIKREKAGHTEFVFEELFDVGGQRSLIWLFDDLVLRCLPGIEERDDVLLDLPNRQDCKVFLVDLNVTVDIVDCVLYFSKSLLIPALDKIQGKLDFNKISLAESLFQMLSGSKAFQSAVNHDG